MEFENELREALARKPAPPGFAGRVVARVEMSRSRRLWSIPMVRRIAAALTLLTLGGIAGYRYTEEQKMRAGERARQQLLTAMEITAEKTTLARRALHD